MLQLAVASFPLRLRVTAIGGSLREKVRHSCIVRPIPCPSLGSAVVPIVRFGEIGAVIDEESNGVLVSLHRRLVQNARGLVGRPIGVDVRTAIEQEQRDLEMLVEDSKCQRDIQHLLHRWRSPAEIAAREL